MDMDALGGGEAPEPGAVGREAALKAQQARPGAPRPPLPHYISQRAARPRGPFRRRRTRFPSLPRGAGGGGGRRRGVARSRDAGYKRGGAAPAAPLLSASGRGAGPAPARARPRPARGDPVPPAPPCGAHGRARRRQEEIRGGGRGVPGAALGRRDLQQRQRGQLRQRHPRQRRPHAAVHPAPAEAAAAQERAVRPGHGVLLRAAPGLHQRAQPGRQLAGHGAAARRRAPLHAGRVRPGAGGEPPRDPARAPQGGEAARQENEAHQERDGGVGGGGGADAGGRVGRRHRRGECGGGRLLLPAAAAHQAAAGAAPRLGRAPHRRRGEAGAARHPAVARGVRLRLPPLLRPRVLRLQPGRDQVPGRPHVLPLRLLPRRLRQHVRAHRVQPAPRADSLSPHHHEAGAGEQAPGRARTRRRARRRRPRLCRRVAGAAGPGDPGLPGVHGGERVGRAAPAERRGAGEAEGRGRLGRRSRRRRFGRLHRGGGAGGAGGAVPAAGRPHPHPGAVSPRILRPLLRRGRPALLGRCVAALLPGGGKGRRRRRGAPPAFLPVLLLLLLGGAGPCWDQGRNGQNPPPRRGPPGPGALAPLSRRVPPTLRYLLTTEYFTARWRLRGVI